MEKCVIVGAAPDVYWDNRWIPDYVLCADGGYEAARRLGFKVDALIGDGDSGDMRGGDGVDILKLPIVKDCTDLHACAEAAVLRGARDVILLGATGGRLDHFLGNMGLLYYFAEHDINATIMDKDNEIFSYKKPCVLKPPHRYRFFSIIPLDSEISGVTLEGARYPLYNETLFRCETRGISNEPLSPERETVIHIAKGSAMIILSERLISQ